MLLLSIERDSLVRRLMRRAILLIKSDRHRCSLAVWPPTCPNHLVVKYELFTAKGGDNCSAVTHKPAEAWT